MTCSRSGTFSEQLCSVQNHVSANISKWFVFVSVCLNAERHGEKVRSHMFKHGRSRLFETRSIHCFLLTELPKSVVYQHLWFLRPLLIKTIQCFQIKQRSDQRQITKIHLAEKLMGYLHKYFHVITKQHFCFQIIQYNANGAILHPVSIGACENKCQWQSTYIEVPCSKLEKGVRL